VSPFPSAPDANAQADPPARPMGTIYLAVVVVEVVTLLLLWWFQSTFGRG
jgi:hypothetical protein